ncbi:hypothetical protein KCU92_g268, partial [Aureobasidium melanogenum]
LVSQHPDSFISPSTLYTLATTSENRSSIVMYCAEFVSPSRYFFCMTGPAFTVRDPIYRKRDAEIEALKG